MNYKNSQIAIQAACSILGSQVALASITNASPGFVNQWFKGRRQVPVAYCSAIEQATHGQVTRKDLRPDDWAIIWPELTAKRKLSKQE